MVPQVPRLRKRDMTRLVLALVLIAALCPQVQARSAHRLSGAEIRVRITGRVITDGAHWSETYERSGKLVVNDVGTVSTGTWRVERDQLCKNRPGVLDECYAVWLDGDRVELRHERYASTFATLREAGRHCIERLPNIGSRLGSGVTAMERRAIIFGALGAATGAAGGQAQPGPGAPDIAHYAIGPLPPDFLATWRTGQGAVGNWRVVADTSASQGKAIEQASTDPTDYRFPLAVYEPLPAQDVEASVRFKAVAGKVDRAGGLAVRLTDADNYYVVRANALEDNVNLYRVVKGRRQQIKGTSAKVSSGEWHSLGLEARGATFRVTFDGKPLFTAEDHTFTGLGKVALWTKADSVTRFDQLAVKPLQ